MSVSNRIKDISELIPTGKYFLNFGHGHEGRIYTFEIQGDEYKYDYIFISDKKCSNFELHSGVHFHTEYSYKEHPELGKITKGLFEDRCLYIGREHLYMLRYIPEVFDLDQDDDDCI